MKKDLTESTKEFIEKQNNKSNNSYLSNHWKEIINRDIDHFSYKNIKKDIESSKYLRHYALFKLNDKYIKHKTESWHQNKEDTLSLRKIIIPSIVANPVLTLRTLYKIVTNSRARDAVFFTQSIVMERIRLLDEYFSYMKNHKFLTDFTSQRLYYYFRIQEIILEFFYSKSISEKYNFLEIGPGSGTSGIFLINNDCVKNYIIVDLPEMLIYSAYHLNRHNKEFNLYFDLPKNTQLNKQENNIFLLTPDQISKIPEKSIDFQFSINALMEMKIDVVSNYIEQMYRIGKEDSIMMLVARINELNLSSEHKELNNPYMYPYKDQDSLIYFGPDFLQDNARAIMRGPFSPSMLRISRINTKKPNTTQINLHRISNFKDILKSCSSARSGLL